MKAVGIPAPVRQKTEFCTLSEMGAGRHGP
jgi:hypothetical protein